MHDRGDEPRFTGRVLIVDDDPFNMNLLVNLMKAAQIHPLVAPDGAEALETAKISEPDLILLDIMMPEMDGFEVCRRLKADEKTKEIPVIFMSALKGIDQKMEGFRLGGADYITKPFRQEEVIARVRTHMTLQQQKKALMDVRNRYKALFTDLKKSEMRYRKLFEEMLNGFALHEMLYDEKGQPADYRYIDINPAFEKLTGLSRKAVVGKTVRQILPNLEPHWVETFGRVAKTGKPAYFTDYSRELDRHYECAAFSTEADQFAVVFADVSDRIRTEKRLKQSLEDVRWGKQLLEKTYNSLKSGVFIIDAESSAIMECNRAAGIIFGYDREELIGKNRAKLFISEERYRKFRENALAGFAEKGFWKIRNYEMKRKSGEVFPTDHTVTPLQDDGGKVICWVSVIQDMTEQKKMEERLQQSQKMEAVGTLAGGIAHDFNNILFPIIGYAEMTFDDLPENSRGRKNLQQILKATDRAKELVAQILTFSRKNAAELRPIRIQSIVKESLKLLRSTLPTTIEIRQNIHEITPVMADPTQVHQVLINLCTNAYHAMRERGGVLSVALDTVSKDDGALQTLPDAGASEYVRLTIEDTGCGMGDEVLKQIFDPYFTTKGIGEGTGLGLSVVDGIIKEHRGFLHVESRLGQGSRFTIFLPTIGNGPDGIPGEEIDAEPVVYGREHILVVDDEESIGTMLRRMLEGLGYTVTIRYSSPDALAAFKSGPDQFDLVITDMTMPNMTGLDLSGRLLEIRPDIPIILTTGFSEMVDEETAKAAGIKEYLLKPIIKRKLSGAIRRALASEKKKSPLDSIG